MEFKLLSYYHQSQHLQHPASNLREDDTASTVILAHHIPQTSPDTKSCDRQNTATNLNMSMNTDT